MTTEGNYFTMQPSQELWAELGIDKEIQKRERHQQPGANNNNHAMQQQHLKINRQHSKTATRQRQITTNSYTTETKQNT
jgi:hypothetical protein